MQNARKKFLGLLGLAFVIAMTVFAYFLPANGAYAEGASDSHTDTIRVTVYDRFPAVKITNPETGAIDVSPVVEVSFDYENSTYVEFYLSYEDENGDTQTVQLPTFNPDPSRLDPVFNFDSDSNTITFSLNDYLLSYNKYALQAKSISPIGYDEDFIEFYYTPVNVIQTGSADTTNNPIVDVYYDDGVAKIELMAVDKNGNPIFDEPVVIYVEPDSETGDYIAGAKTITLPFNEYGLATGDYDLIATAYSATVTPGEIDPDSGEQGEDTIDYAEIASPYDTFVINYVQPPAPDVPNTGGKLLGDLNIAKSDFAITGIIAFIGITMVAMTILSRRKKNYRKNIRTKK